MPNIPKRLAPLRAKAPITEQRRARNDMYKGGLWRQLRRDQLEKEPLCRICAANHKLTPATEADHIIPHRGDRALFADPRNLQSLCRACHSRKTAAEDGGFGNRARRPSGGRKSW